MLQKSGCETHHRLSTPTQKAPLCQWSYHFLVQLFTHCHKSLHSLLKRTTNRIPARNKIAMRKVNIEKPCTCAHSIFIYASHPLSLLCSTALRLSHHRSCTHSVMALTLTPWGGSKADLIWKDGSAAFKAALVMCSSTACPATPQIPVTMKVPAKSATADPAIKASLLQRVIMRTNCLLHCCACCRFL